MMPRVILSMLLAGCVLGTSLSVGPKGLNGGSRALKYVYGRDVETIVRQGLRPKARSPTPEAHVGLLRKVYNLKKAAFGTHRHGVILGNDGCIAPIASAYLMVYSAGCGMWNFFYQDSLFMWHKGKSMVDLIYLDGTYERVCLGDTLKDKNCRYVVHMPARTKIFFWTEGQGITSSIIFGGHVSDANPMTFEELESKYADSILAEVIQKTKSCDIGK